jgi:hypothetical protein
MGDNVVEAQVREIVTRFQGDSQRVVELLQKEQEQMQARIRELGEQLGKEREHRQCAEKDAEEYRRFAQKLYAKLHPPTQEDIDWWRNLNLADQTVSLEEILAEIENMPE